MKLRVLLAVVASLLVFTAPVSASTAPAGFLPSSIDWLSTDHGAVLGYAPCEKEFCPHLLVTVDGGNSWHEVNPPPVPLPENHNQVKLTVVDARNAFVSDGDSLWATNDASTSWYPVTLAGLDASRFIGRVQVAFGRVFAVGSALGNSEKDFTRIYAGPLGARTLEPLPEMVATGLSYGDLSVDGGVVQAYVGSDYSSAQYWLSRDGIEFTPAPLPCPVTNWAILGEVVDGRPTALCSGSGGSPSPGHMTKQVFVAPEPGAPFTGLGEAPSRGLTQAFAPVSATSFTIAAVGGSVGLLHRSVDGGKSWTTLVLEERGFSLADLQFVNERIGYVVDGVPSSFSGSAVWRTTDGGETWQEMTF